ncbi:hypothetical protein [Methylobacterium brachiatum]
MTAGFGQIPSFADLSPADMADLIQRMELGSQDPRNSGPQPGTQGQPPQFGGLGQLLGLDPATTGSTGRDAPPVAMSEAEAQRLERQQASPQDLAALGGSPVDRLLFDRAGMGGGPGGFSGVADPYGQRAVPLPPARPSDAVLQVQPTATGLLPPAGTAPNAPGGRMPLGGRPASAALVDSARDGSPSAGASAPAPVNAFDPLSGQPVSGSLRPLGAPQGAISPAGAAMAPGQTGGVVGQPGAVMEKFRQGVSVGNPAIGDLLFHLGIGIASNRGIGPGVAAGLQSYGASQAGSIKGQLEQVKYMQEQQGLQDTYNHLTQNLKLDPTAARAAMRNPTLLSNVLAQTKPNLQTIGGQIYDLNKNGGLPSQANLVGPANGPPAGYRLAADGRSYEFIPGSDADPAVQERNARAVATDKEQTPLLDIDARRKVGIPDNDTRAAWADPNGKVTFNDGPPPLAARPGQTFYDRGTLKPILTAPAAKPDGFDTETKLRGEFSKQLGTFADVHDGYGRLIAATKQREANPGTVSPASDISLVFGYMKMLDPGSVVREGEYATAKNAAGVPERVMNAYNKALNGEFLSDTQRKDFLGQASELYGTARKTAEGVAERYRNLATSYGADPGRSVYLPEAPTPPKLGQQSQAPAGGAAARYQALIQGGMSKADAFAQMHKEGL